MDETVAMVVLWFGEVYGPPPVPPQLDRKVGVQVYMPGARWCVWAQFQSAEQGGGKKSGNAAGPSKGFKPSWGNPTGM